MSRPRRHLVTPTLILCCAAIAAACDVTHPAAPNATASRNPRVHFDVVDTLGSFSIPTPTDNGTNSGALASTFTGLVIGAHVMHYLYATGTIGVGANANYTCCFTDPSTPAAGSQIGPLGWVDPQGDWPQFGLTFGDDHSNPAIHSLGSNQWSPVVTDTEYPANTDSIYVARSGITGGASCNSYGNGDLCECPSGSCITWSAGAYTFSGAEVVYVVLAPQPTFTLTATPDTVSANQGVTVSPVITPTYFGSQRYYVNWGGSTWTFAGTPQSCYTGCTIYPTQSGTMVVTMPINGQVMTDSIAIVVQ